MRSLSHQFLDFCRSKPADEEFDPTESSECAFYQFADANGIPDPDRDALDIPEVIWQAIVDCVQTRRRPGKFFAREDKYTFGALADRLEAELVK